MLRCSVRETSVVRYRIGGAKPHIDASGPRPHRTRPRLEVTIKSLNGTLEGDLVRMRYGISIRQKNLQSQAKLWAAHATVVMNTTTGARNAQYLVACLARREWKGWSHHGSSQNKENAQSCGPGDLVQDLPFGITPFLPEATSFSSDGYGPVAHIHPSFKGANCTSGKT